MASKEALINCFRTRNEAVTIEEPQGNRILVVRVPRAMHRSKPVYTRGNPLTGSYRRNGEGDYHCSEDEVSAMLRDAGSDPSDSPAVESLELDAICPDTLQRYRDELELKRPGYPWARLGNEDLLVRLGAAGFGSDSRIHPTRAGLVMFGFEHQIVRELPFYFLDYRETGTARRWDDRLTSSDGDWSGNVLDFWLRVSQKLSSMLRRPFNLDARMMRVDDTPLHRALREGLTNVLLHADYCSPSSCTVVVYDNRAVFTNPGTMLVDPQIALSGGTSRTRNPMLARMFNPIAIGERAGSGFDAMREGCAWAGAGGPEIGEDYGPDRVTLTLPTIASNSTRNAL